MSEPLPKAVLLDLDDTILVDGAAAAACWREVCEVFAPRCGLPPDGLQAAIQTYADWYYRDPDRHRTGRLDLNATRRAIVAAALTRLGTGDETLAGAVAHAYAEARERALAPFPGALEALDRLRTAGVRLALLTNGSPAIQRRKIEHFRLGAYFDCVIVEGEFGAGKPDARVYRHALAKLGARPFEAWMAGDNLEWDVAAPQRLGLRGIWVDVAGAGLPSDSAVRPDRVIRALPELLDG